MRKALTIFCLLLLWGTHSSKAQAAFADDEPQNEDSLAADMAVEDTISIDKSLVWPENLKQHLTRLCQTDMLQTSQAGIMVYDLTADSTLFAINERQLLRPASTMKLLTAIAGIDRLGGSHRFRTSLCYTGNIANNTLTGDLYCIGGFDPMFNSDDMNAFIESLHRMGVDTIRGRILADNSMKDNKQYGKGWCWDDKNPLLLPLIYQRKDVFVEHFIKELNEQNIITEITIGKETAPHNAYSICTRFHTMDQVLMRMMKESDNLYAEALFYQLAASSGNRPATASNATSVIRQLINKVGLGTRPFNLSDGCGLSPYNYISAEIEVALLRYAFRNNNIYVHLYPSLPIAGEDGTLQKRMRSGNAAGNVHAKTGSLTAVSTLAGYCTASNGHLLCFAILNQGVMHTSNARTFQNRICEALCQPYQQ